MTTPARGALRVLRAAALAVLVLGVSAGSHALAGGSLPAPGRTALLALATGAVCAAVTRWRLSLPGAAAVLGGGQLVLHEALMALSPTTVASAATPGAMDGMGAAGHAAHGPAAAAAEAASQAAAAAGDLTMVLAHAAAATTLALVYARGEDALWGLWAWLAPLAAVVLALPPAAVRPRPRPAVLGADLPRTRPELHGALWRRGPPRAALATA